METDHHSVTWKYIKREKNRLRQILDKMKSLSDIKQLLKKIKMNLCGIEIKIRESSTK